MDDRIITMQKSDDERSFESALRPQSLHEYVGQARMKESLRICMEAALPPTISPLFSTPSTSRRSIFTAIPTALSSARHLQDATPNACAR